MTLRLPKLPFVSRLAFEMAIDAKNTAIQHADSLEREIDRVRKDALLQVTNAYGHSTKSLEQAHLAIAEARGAMREAVDMSKAASVTMFGPVIEGEPPVVSSIRSNDRATAVARKRERDSVTGR